MMTGIELLEEGIKLHNIYACYNCPREVNWNCIYRRRSKTMSNLDQWINCRLLHVLSVNPESSMRS
jgi:histidinol phosphatase-like enzyme